MSASGAKPGNDDAPWFSVAQLPLSPAATQTDVTLDISEAAGSGAVIADLDGDSRPDLVLPGTGGGRTRLGCTVLLNSASGWKAAAATGIPQDQAWRGCAVGDLDGDDKPDLVLTGLRLLAVFRNVGAGQFSRVDPGLNHSDRWYTAPCFLDANRDGQMDCYVGAYVTFNRASPRFSVVGHEQKTGERVVGAGTSLLYPAERGRLFLNRGVMKFQDVTTAWGLDRTAGRTLGVLAEDFNQDGLRDLFLSNDRTPSELYLNEGGKRFVRVPDRRAPAFGRDGEILSLHAAAAGDVNGDKRLDIVAGAGADQVSPLFIATPGGGFEDEARLRGLIGTFRYTANGVALSDFDGDSAPDLLLANGNWISTAHRISREPGVDQPLQLFLNRGGRFELAPVSVFPTEARRINARGLAVADVNGDGHPDALIQRMNAEPLLLTSIAGKRL